jgi:hypothetical protein
MKPSIQIQISDFPVVVVVRTAAAVLILIGVFVIGFSAPVDRMLVQDARAGAVDPAELATYGNGPTGYFPDMFEHAARAAEPVEPIEAF